LNDLILTQVVRAAIKFATIASIHHNS